MYAVYARGGGSILDWFSKVGDCRAAVAGCLFLSGRAVSDTRAAAAERKKFAILVKGAGEREREEREGGWMDRRTVR